MRLQFHFKVVVSPKDDKSSVISITALTTEEGKCYVMPEELQYMPSHEELMKTSMYTKTKASLKRRHDKLNVWFPLSEELREKYFDEAGNVEIAGQLLKEIEYREQTHSGETELTRILQMLAESSQRKNEEKRNLKHLSDKFIIEKFNMKETNAKQWLEIFEKECRRFEVETDQEMIEVVRFFLEGACQNWYNSRRIKEDEFEDWESWKKTS